MELRTPPPGYLFERFDPQRHDRTAFSCGSGPIDSFLRKTASQDQEKGLSKSFVLVESADTSENKRPIVGFVTLVTTIMPVPETPDAMVKLTHRGPLAVLLLARMGVDPKHKGKGLGEHLVAHALDSACNADDISNCLGVIVDPKPDVIDFYTQYGFTELEDRKGRLFLPTTTIRTLSAHTV